MPILVMDISTFIVLLFHLLAILTFRFGNCTQTFCIPSEHDALLRFKSNLTDHSNRLSSWIASNPNCCDWAGVVCNNISTHVLQLHLNISPPDIDDNYFIYNKAYEAYDSSRFGGEISPSLLELKHLNHLDLSGNYFGGMQIPSFLWEMTTLTYLNLSNAGFGGKISHQIGNLSNLLYLDLRSVANGTIPYQIGNLTNLLHLGLQSYDFEPLFAESLHWLSGLSHLQYLDLVDVNLSKSFDWLQTLQALPSLMELHLPGCVLPSEYNHPSSLNFSSLLTLDLSSYQYRVISFVPNWIFGLRKLVSLQLSENDIHGQIPDGIQNLTLVENLDLSYNSFSSSIPDWLYRLHHLKSLNLQWNNLRGTISDALGNLTSLVELDLAKNHLEGRIPTSLGNLCNLRELHFSYRKLNQQVNEILEILTPCVSHGLTRLEISSSQLSGNLTDQIGVFKNIVTLDFSNNSIRGVLPRSLGRLSLLRSLDLSKNQFNGNPFEVLRSLSKLSDLSIDDNLFQGVVKDDDLESLTSLKVFRASGNNFTLEVGPNWHPSFQLYELGMSSWQLGPNFPPWIRSQEHLVSLAMSNTGILDSIPAWFWETLSSHDSEDASSYLNLSHNHIHGELASTLMKVIPLWTVDLSSNHLFGKIPYLFLDYVGWLDLSSNSFSGSITDFLCEKQERSPLEVLNLASNNLSGEIPDCWRMCPYLADVNLESNHFVGNLPPSIGLLTELATLHIRNNSLSGVFPSVLKNTNDLISLDLGENRLTGIIPTWVGKRLPNLKILRLRSNRFFGHIPKEICDMTFLQDLDLAQNNLSGNIPNCFNHLDAMLLRNTSKDSFISSNASIPYRGRSTVSSLLWVKGRGIEYRNNLGLVTNVDLSDNNLSGEIPREITNLDGLIYLNLSKNQLSGRIPPSIGNMISLESIDFSRNHLSGEIPETISNISFLSQLDLSYNNLKGRIPTATQLQTFEASGFVGNDLCGLPLPVNCSSNVQIPFEDDNDKESDGHGVNWFFMSMALGFIVGFWAVVAPLFMFRSWRHTYYGFLDDMWYKIQSCWRM